MSVFRPSSNSKSVSQYVLVSSTLVGLTTRYYFLSECCCLKFAVLYLLRPLWREDGFAICSVITQWSESLRTRNHTLLSHLRLSEPGEPGSRIYISQEQGGPVIPPGTGFDHHQLFLTITHVNKPRDATDQLLLDLSRNNTNNKYVFIHTHTHIYIYTYI
jgi:hypothetical protein